jgi:hypothetical protein
MKYVTAEVKEQRKEGIKHYKLVRSQVFADIQTQIPYNTVHQNSF